jgi:hypothetical protein
MAQLNLIKGLFMPFNPARYSGSCNAKHLRDEIHRYSKRAKSNSPQTFYFAQSFTISHKINRTIFAFIALVSTQETSFNDVGVIAFFADHQANTFLIIYIIFFI